MNINRYTYKNSMQYKKYCIKELLKIRKYDVLNKVKYLLNILKDLFNFKADIKQDYDLIIILSDYMPKFYANVIYDYLKYGSNHKFFDMTINQLNNTVYYLTKTISEINKKINDLYYTLI